LLGGNVDLAIAFRDSDLGKTSGSKCKGGESCEQHFDVDVYA
jgi:hypothetical protein